MRYNASFNGWRRAVHDFCRQICAHKRPWRNVTELFPRCFRFSSRAKFSLVLFSFVTREITQLGWIVIAGYAHSLIEREYLSRCNYRGWLIRSKFGIMGWKGVCDSTRVGEILDLFGLFKDQTIFMISIWSRLSFWSEMIKI